MSTPVEITRVGQHCEGYDIARREAKRMAPLHLLCQHLEADAFHPAGGAAEGFVDYFVRQAHTAGIEPERIYIEFSDAARSMWGWNSSTF